MLAKCQTWRQTVEGVGLDALYDEIDPFDVSLGARQPTVLSGFPVFLNMLCADTQVS